MKDIAIKIKYFNVPMIKNGITLCTSILFVQQRHQVSKKLP
jgi:hypothetical protein